MEEHVRRRRRIRSTEAPAESTVDTPPVADPEPVEVSEAPWGAHAQADSGASERGLRGLVGGGSTQVSVAAALRARDAARPTEDDLARAEEELIVVRRHWTPRDQDGSSGSFGRVDS
jgi:hypothetical protein